MAGDPLRALFLDVGVDDKNAITALQKITLSANIAERALRGVAEAARQAGQMGGLAASNRSLASSYNSLASAAARSANAMRQAGADPLGQYWNMQGVRGFGPAGKATGAIQAARAGQVAPIVLRPALGGAGNMPFTVVQGGAGPGAALAIQNAIQNRPFAPGIHPSVARGRGNYGLGTSIFLTSLGIGAASYGYQQAAQFQRSSQLAAFASGQSPAAVRSQAQALRSEYRMRLGEAGSLTQEVAQLGTASPEARLQLARAGAGFHVLEQQVTAGDAAAAIYRLIRATSRSEEEFNAGTSSATRYAGAIYAAGNVSAAGAAAVFSMVQELEPLAQIMNLGAGGVIALSAAFSDLNENQRELFRGSLTRMTIQGKIDPNNPVASLVAMAERLKAAGSDAEKINLMKMMGFDNIRDVQLLSVFAGSLETFANASQAVNEELQGTSTFGTKVQTVLAGMQGSWDGFKSSLDNVAATIMTSLAPALQTLLGLLAGVADMISASPMLALAAGGAATWMGGRAAVGLWRRHFGGLSLTQSRALMSSAQLREYGRTSRGISTILPVGISKRLALTGFGANLAEGAFLGNVAGVGRMSSLSLGLMRNLPFIGERLAIGVGGRMAAGGLAGAALRIGTGPIGWIITALTLGAPLFERIGRAFHDIAQKGGFVGIVFNTLSLIFDLLAAGGRILNKAFEMIGHAIYGFVDWITFGNADNIFKGTNSFLESAQSGINSIASDKAGASSSPKAPGTSVTINTGGSQSGFQMAMDEVSRRSATTMPSNNYGGIPV